MKGKKSSFLRTAAAIMAAGMFLLPAVKVEADDKAFEADKGERFENASQISLAESLKAREEKEKVFREEILSYDKEGVRLLTEIKGLLEKIEVNTRKEEK